MDLDYQELKPILVKQRQKIVKSVLKRHPLASPYKVTFVLAWMVAGCEKNEVNSPFEVLRIQKEAGEILRAMSFNALEELINQ
jgi:hypothetical protein